jgi:hypothetical protein
MSDRATDRRLTADDRYDLAVAADSASRRNRPSHLVAFAGLFFVVACAVMGFTACRASQAEEDLSNRVSQRDAVAEMLAELEAIARAEDPEAEAVNEPYPGFRSKMEEIALEVGLSEKLEFPRRNSPNSGIPGVSQVTYDYTIEEPTLGPMLRFARAASEQIPGTRVAGIKLRPRPDKWQMDIKFERWERTPQP